MKLKGYLKGLCIFGLSLLPITFTNAGLQEFDLGQLESITANTSLGYNLRLTQNANFLTNDLYKVVQFKGSGQYPATWNYFWNGTGMYVTVSCVGGYSCNGSILKQGFINYVNIVDLSTIDMTYGPNLGLTSVNDFLTNSDYNNPDKLLIGGYGEIQKSNLCFGYSDLDKAVCFSVNYSTVNNCNSYPQYCNYLSNSLSLTTQSITELASIATTSPFTVISSPSYNTGTTLNGNVNSAQNLYDSYRSLGYQDFMCYGGFALDDLLLTGSSFRDLQVGSGATIFQLYNAYSGGMNSLDWWNSYDFDYGFLVDYQDYDPFIGKSKGLAGLFVVRDVYYKKNDFDFNLLWGFCGLSLTNSNIDRTKSPLDIISDTVAQHEVSSVIGDLGVIVPASGSALDVLIQSLSGAGYVMRGDDDDFYSLLQSGFTVITDSTYVPGTNYPGILPTYIIVGFLGIMLFYVFKH